MAVAHPVALLGQVEGGGYEAVYQSQYGALFRGDCSDLLGDLPAESIHMIFADPPFNSSFR